MPDSAGRWQLRFENFRSALELLDEAVVLESTRGLSELEKAGLIQRFEIAWELGWKTMADYLREADPHAAPFASGPTVRLAVAAGLIEDGDAWSRAGKLRNILAHEYSRARRDEGIALIQGRFLPLLRACERNLRERG